MKLATISKALYATSAAIVALIGAGVLTGVALSVATVAVAVVGALIVGITTYASPANK